MTKQSGTERYAARRAEMAAETRTRILDACIVILSKGVAELSIPAVAEEAGVSVPTVYRNFPDKKTLVTETAMYLRDLRRPRAEGTTTLATLHAALTEEYTRTASLNETVKAALMSEPVLAARKDSGMRESRIKQSAELLAPATTGMSAADKERLAKIVAVWCSSWAQRGFADVVGASPEEAADIVAWGVARLLGRESLSDEPVTSKKKR